jgi:hypothetical protein
MIASTDGEHNMKVKQLIALLQQCDGEMEVTMETGSGDYWRTVLARPVRAVGEASVKHSAYHNIDKIVGEEDDNDNTRTVIAIS